VFRVFRGLKSPQTFGFRFPPFAFRFLDVYFVVKNFVNFIFGHRRSRLVTFGHLFRVSKIHGSYPCQPATPVSHPTTTQLSPTPRLLSGLPQSIILPYFQPRSAGLF
jgi:hypothetical protein